jgi:hypothetical protein
MELGALPTADGQCVPWKTTYSERDTVRATKDYRLCRGVGPQSLYVDEGGGVTLQTSLLGDVLVSSFKAGRVLLVTHLRVRGDTLEEEIITADDLPATVVDRNGVAVIQAFDPLGRVTSRTYPTSASARRF